MSSTFLKINEKKLLTYCCKNDTGIKDYDDRRNKSIGLWHVRGNEEEKSSSVPIL